MGADEEMEAEGDREVERGDEGGTERGGGGRKDEEVRGWSAGEEVL